MSSSTSLSAYWQLRQPSPQLASDISHYVNLTALVRGSPSRHWGMHRRYYNRTKPLERQSQLFNLTRWIAIVQRRIELRC